MDLGQKEPDNTYIPPRPSSVPISGVKPRVIFNYVNPSKVVFNHDENNRKFDLWRESHKSTIPESTKIVYDYKPMGEKMHGTETYPLEDEPIHSITKNTYPTKK